MKTLYKLRNVVEYWPNKTKSLCLQIFRSLSCHEKIVLDVPKSVVFFGTDGFALASLKLLVQNSSKGFIKNIHVVTSTKKPHAAVLKYCIESNIPYDGWPLQNTLHGFDLGIVVSFGHLIPAFIIASFPLGILNVHGSLLPRWRGPAPIIHAVLNGDQNTGITIMKIFPDKFDIGEIVYQRSVEIERGSGSAELAKRMEVVGAECLQHTLFNLPTLLKDSRPQPSTGITTAPKIAEWDCRIVWDKMNPDLIYSMHLAFEGCFPLWSNWHNAQIKLLELSGIQPDNSTVQQMEVCSSVYKLLKVLRSSPPKNSSIIEEEITAGEGAHIVPGQVVYLRQEKLLRIRCFQGFIHCNRVALKGKKTMTALEFYNGFISKVEHRKRYFH